MNFFIKPVSLMWDVDEGTLILGDNIEVRTQDPMSVVKYFTDLGVTVVYTDRDAGTTTTFEPGDDEDFKGQDDTMLKVRGRTFRCECGTNVFKKSKTSNNLYRCNGCKDLLVSESA